MRRFQGWKKQNRKRAKKRKSGSLCTKRKRQRNEREPTDFSAIQQSYQLTKGLILKVQTLIVTVEKNLTPKNKQTDTKQKKQMALVIST